MVSISEREQQALDSIENDLARSGPELASKLAMFGRLTAGEAMPARDRVRRATGVAASRTGPRRITRRPIGRLTWHWLWLAAAIALVVLALTVGHGTGKSACPLPRVTACARAPAPTPSGTGTAGRL